jgi:predicted glycosyltransferase
MARLVFYSHDGFGLGHVRRNLALSRRIVELDPSSSVLVVTGSDVATQFDLSDGTDILELPSLAKVSNGVYTARRLRVDAEAVHRLRADILAAAVRSFRPHVMVVDKSPLGPGGELIPALHGLHQVGGRAVLGLRDVLDDGATVATEWTPEAVPAILTHYSRVLVYGSEGFLDPLVDYALPDAVRGLSAYCGYVVNDPPGRVAVPWRDDCGPVVLATAGGGEDGAALLEAFVHAAIGAPWRGVVVAGPMIPPDEFARLSALGAEAGVRVVSFIPALVGWFAAVDAVVSMGGYNTLVEAVSTGVPIVCVPRVEPRIEQLIRARAFADRGLLRLLEPDSLSPMTLRASVDAALADGRDPARAALLEHGGADCGARELLEIASLPRHVVRRISVA